MEIHAIRTHHKEIYDYLDEDRKKIVQDTVGATSSPLGLRIECSSRGEPFSITIPGDTGFPETDDGVREFAAFFGNGAIASIHLGSIESGWSRTTVPSSGIKYKDGNHLGLTGVAKFLSLTRPRVAIITEFGEELDARDVQLALIEIIKSLLGDSKTIIIPSDVMLNLAIDGKDIYFKCGCRSGFVPIEKIEYKKDKDGYLEYSFSSGCKSGLDHVLFK